MRERYWVFGGVDVPGRSMVKGGFRDFQFDFAKLEQAKAYAEAWGRQPYSWTQVVDTHEGKLLEEYEGLYE